jgi:hypothetical protein
MTRLCHLRAEVARSHTHDAHQQDAGGRRLRGITGELPQLHVRVAFPFGVHRRVGPGDQLLQRLVRGELHEPSRQR